MTTIYKANALSLDAPLREIAQLDPNRTFIRDISKPDVDLARTYSQANRLVEGLARQIVEWDIPVVGVVLSTSYECLCLVYAVMRAGKDVLLLDPEWGRLSQEAIVRETGLKAVVADTEVSGPLASLQRRLDFSEHPQNLAAVNPSLAASTHILIFTSGTTSKPKGIVLTQSAMMVAYGIGQHCLGIGQQTRVGCFYRVSGLGILGLNFLFPILYGGSVVLLPTYIYTEGHAFWSVVRDAGINFLYLVPPIVNYLVKECDGLDQPFRLSELLCVAGSARLDPDVQSLFQQRFAPLANIYGLSECGFAFLFGRRVGDQFNNSVGPAVGIELQLKDEEGELIIKPGVKGRLYVKTASLFEGYLNNPELTDKVSKDGWLDTNDLAYLDTSGDVYLIGRIDGTIKKAGNLFHLAECDEALMSLEHVVEASCVKVACEIHGEDYVAIVRVKDGHQAFRFESYLSDALGATRAPKAVALTTRELPRNGAGKYDRGGLLAMWDQNMQQGNS